MVLETSLVLDRDPEVIRLLLAAQSASLGDGQRPLRGERAIAERLRVEPGDGNCTRPATLEESHAAATLRPEKWEPTGRAPAVRRPPGARLHRFRSGPIVKKLLGPRPGHPDGGELSSLNGQGPVLRSARQKARSRKNKKPRT